MTNRCLFTLLLLLLPVAGCGYHNPYVPAAGEAGLPITLHLAMWENHTNELGLESTIFQTLNSWFRRNPRVRLTQDRAAADFHLRGQILAITLPGSAYTRYDQAQEVEATLTVRFTLRKNNPDAVVCQKDGLTLSKFFTLTNDAASTRGNKEKALAAMADDLAEQIYDQVLDSTIAR